MAVSSLHKRVNFVYKKQLKSRRRIHGDPSHHWQLCLTGQSSKVRYSKWANARCIESINSLPHVRKVEACATLPTVQGPGPLHLDLAIRYSNSMGFVSRRVTRVQDDDSRYLSPEKGEGQTTFSRILTPSIEMKT